MATGNQSRSYVLATRWRKGLLTNCCAAILVVALALVPAVSASGALSAPVRNGPTGPIGALLATLPDPAPNPNDAFGNVVAVSGKIAVVGAYGLPSDTTGVAYIFTRNASGWPTTPTATLLDPAANSNDFFGVDVAVSGTAIIVGAPGTNSSSGAAYLYVKSASGWPTTPTATFLDPAANPNDYFGNVAVSQEGTNTTVVIGADDPNAGPGSVYVYVNGGSGWPTTPTTTLADPAATSGDQFGETVATSGTAIVVGAPGTNSA